MTDETKQEIEAVLMLLKNTLVSNGVSIAIEKKDDGCIMFFDTAEYRAIGTPEECRAAVEKQTAKKPMHVTNSYFGYQKHKEHVGYCPDCGHQVEEPYGCPNCLRKIDWSDEE